MASDNIEILKKLNVGITKFPRDISLEYNDSSNPHKLVMKLTKKAAGFSNPINMQDNRACFEAWCLIIKAKTNVNNLKIELDVNGGINSYTIGQPSNGHLGRFLYRILKFSEQYNEWFELSSTLEVLKDKFKYYLVLPGVKLVASEHDKEASDNLDDLKNNLESYIEYVFWDSNRAKRDILKLHREAIVGRQLLVGLYDGTKGRCNEVFTGGTSAADFWAVDGDTINVYELKVNNPMVGIITEIFFYSNYVHDVFISKSMDHGKGCVTPEDGMYRSYNKIDGKQVKGIMLSNSNRKGWHSSLVAPIRMEIEKIMNANGMPGEIQYEFLEYQLNPLKIGGYYISNPLRFELTV